MKTTHMLSVNYVTIPHHSDNMSAKTPISTLNLFVFNSTLGPREGEEHKKILYYYPPETDIDLKIKNVGLCEAVAKFTETFTEKDCQSLHTQKTRQILYQPEPDYWMVLTLSIPYSQKTKDGQTYSEYHEDDVQDTVYESVLQEAYRMFRLFMGTFTHITSKYQIQGLKQRLEHFYNRYILTLRLGQCDILDLFNGIGFLPLDKNTYLQIQCFINQLEASFPQIRYSAFLYSDQLVWSGLEQDDMRVMYRYLTTSLFPSTMEQEMQGSQPAVGTAPNTHYGKYITGPPNINDEKNPGKIPRVFINTDIQIEECNLIVYKALSASVCLLVDGDFQLTFDFYRKLDNYLGPLLSNLASEISEQYPRRSSLSGEPQYKYVYFNHMNLAQKTTIHADSKKTASVNIPTDILKLIADLNFDLNNGATENGEIIVKGSGEYWVVGIRSDQREFYCVINQKGANLIEINDSTMVGIVEDTVSMANLDLLALCCAVRNNDVISISQILQDQPWFAREQIISEGEKQTLLLLACRNNAAGAAKILVEDYGLDVLETGDIQSEDKQYEGVSPLWCAAGEGNIEIATFLLQSGAKVNQMTVTKSTPLRSACYNNKFDMVKFLIDRKAAIDFPKNDGSTSLMVAAYHGHTDIVKLLLERGANINLQDDQGASALNDACRQGHEEIVKILLASGADVNLQGKHGVTALGDACRHGNLNIINKLLDLGALPGVDERGMTPLEVAAENGHEEVIITWVCRESCSKEERVEALELLGAHFMCKRDYQKMYAYMMKAMKDRTKYVLPKEIQPPIEAYDHKKECETVEELQAIATDVEALQYQAVILRERILGNRKMDEFPIALLGAVHADAHNYDKCMALWCRALYHLKKNGDSLTHRLVAFCEVFSEILMNSGTLNRDMVSSITKTAIEEIELSRLRLKDLENDNNISIEKRTEDFLPNIYVSLWLLKLVHFMSEPDRFCRQVLELVQELCKQNIHCNPHNRPLLHLVLDDTTPCGDFPLEIFVSFPDVTLLKQMIICGVDVKQTDEMGNTALHVLASNMSPQTIDRTNYVVMIRLLLEAGIHHDQTNCMRQVAQNMGSSVVTEILQMIIPIASLQCLSARVIKSSVRDYEVNLPPSLVQFVALH